MDSLRIRVETLTQQMHMMGAQARAVAQRQGRWHLRWSIAVALGVALALPLAVQAKTFYCGAGDVPCLIAAIKAANAHSANANGPKQKKSTIYLAAGTYTLTAVDNL